MYQEKELTKITKKLNALLLKLKFTYERFKYKWKIGSKKQVIAASFVITSTFYLKVELKLLRLKKNLLGLICQESIYSFINHLHHQKWQCEMLKLQICWKA